MNVSLKLLRDTLKQTYKQLQVATDFIKQHHGEDPKVADMLDDLDMALVEAREEITSTEGCESGHCRLEL